ncbi:MAG TPA: maleylpyruvate isomerase family mycothiol-dependent enzyme, partial [Pedococcus sp.]|nr:maleylpyruvate isomerase family mycothiol-dependent enzyme [Pedococcus sp.]
MPAGRDAWQAPPRPSALELLERSTAYCGASLRLVTVADLGRATPCAGWTLGDLLRHVDDSLAALDEAAEGGTISLSCAPRRVADLELVDRVCDRARGLLGHWIAPHGTGVALGTHQVPLEVLAAVGALELTLHGWDVGRALGRPRALPAALARDLWPVACQHIAATDRPVRFGAVRRVRPGAGPEELLL